MGSKPERLLALAIILPLLLFFPYVVFVSIPIVRGADAGFGHAELVVK